MSTYLVRMTPLEPFTFGGEKGFRFESQDVEKGRNNTANISYYQTSRELPEQTTIIGMLRYLILRHNGVAKDFCKYTNDDKQKIHELIGESSFSFQNREFLMGKLKSVSPVFIVDQEQNFEKISYYIRNPLNNIGDKTYRPMKMNTQKIVTSVGKIELPVVDSDNGYTTKTHLNYGYLNIGTVDQPKAEFVENMFESRLITGNRKNNKKNNKKNDEDGFFKRQALCFKCEKDKKYSFAVFVECEDGILPKNMLSYMGLKKSSFRVECTKVIENDLINRIKNALKGKDIWYYALSDILLYDEDNINSFSIISKKQVRNMETNLNEDSFSKAVKRAKNQYNLIEAGSVFWSENPIHNQNENLKNAGYNYTVKIGGME